MNITDDELKRRLEIARRMPGEPAVKTGWSLRLPSIVVVLKRCGYRQVRECVRV